MIPIVFIHYGDSDYLGMVFELAKKFNPCIDIYLLGDKNNIQYRHLGIKHDFFNKYHTGKLLTKFANCYQCMSNIGNDSKVTFDFYRWFYLYNFMSGNGIDQCWYFDSDTFICSDLSVKAAFFKKYELYIINHISGCVCLINRQEILRKYIELLIQLYKNREFIDEQKRILEDHKGNGSLYSFCDMTVFRELQKTYGPFGEMASIINWESFDPNINCDCANIIESKPVWEMETTTLGSKRPIKKLYFIDGLPYCHYLPTGEKIRMNTLNLSWIPYNVMESIYNKINGME